MKKTILIVSMALAATTVMIAKDGEQQCERRGPNPEKRVEHQVQRLDKELDLTDAQEQQVKQMYTEFDKAQKERMEQMRKQEQAERDALNTQIESVLTADQKAKYAEMKEKEREHMRDGRRGHGRRGHGPGHGHGGPGHGHGHGPGHGPDNGTGHDNSTGNGE